MSRRECEQDEPGHQADVLGRYGAHVVTGEECRSKSDHHAVTADTDQLKRHRECRLLCEVSHGQRSRGERSSPQAIAKGPAMTTTIARSPLGAALRSCFPALIATFVLSMFINASMLASPLYSMQVYDRVLTSRNIGTLVMLTLIV